MSALEDEIHRLGPWFHNLHLPDGTQTCPQHALGDFPSFKWRQLAPHLPARLDGWRVLDIGCNAGFYCFELARRGAEVVGIDMDETYLAQARWAARRMGAAASGVEFRRQQVYDLGKRGERFDLVLFMGVFYHLRYPLLGLDAVARCVDRLMVFQTLSLPTSQVIEDTGGLGLDDRARLEQEGWPTMAFVEHELARDRTNWWVPNGAAVEAMIRSTGMKIVGRPLEETYLCVPDRGGPSCFWAWGAEEFYVASGRAAEESR